MGVGRLRGHKGLKTAQNGGFDRGRMVRPERQAYAERTGGSMDRWIIIGAVVAIFACLGVGGWYFQRGVQHPATICSNPDARCGDDRHL